MGEGELQSIGWQFGNRKNFRATRFAVPSPVRRERVRVRFPRKEKSRVETLNRGTIPGSAGVPPASSGFRLPTGRRDVGAQEVQGKFNAHGNRRRNNDDRCRCRRRACHCRRRWPRRRWKISWTISLSRNAGIRCFSNRSSGRGFRCRARTSRNEIRKSA